MSVCKFCELAGHTAFKCPKRPRKPLKTTKPMKKIGKVGKQTASAVAKWKRTVKPNHEGYYECYICGRWVEYNMAEHVKSKARHPELRTDYHNLAPVCASCNEAKGSHDN